MRVWIASVGFLWAAAADAEPLPAHCAAVDAKVNAPSPIIVKGDYAGRTYEFRITVDGQPVPNDAKPLLQSGENCVVTS